MPTVKTSKGELRVPQSQVVRMADRYWCLPSEGRGAALAQAKARLEGRYPCRRDAALISAID